MTAQLPSALNTKPATSTFRCWSGAQLTLLGTECGAPSKLLLRGEVSGSGDSTGMLLAIPDGSHGGFPPWAAPRVAQEFHPSPPRSADTTEAQLQRAGLCLVRESTLWDMVTSITLLHPRKESQDRAGWQPPSGPCSRRCRWLWGDFRAVPSL